MTARGDGGLALKEPGFPYRFYIIEGPGSEIELIVGLHGSRAPRHWLSLTSTIGCIEVTLATDSSHTCTSV